MKIIEVKTADNMCLYGCLYGENFKGTCVILTNGTCGNIFENRFMRVIGEQLEKNGISLLFAHNRGAFHRIDTETANGRPAGATYELFDGCLLDLQAYVDLAKQLGYRRIILGGHSYGTNKVVYYLSLNQNENIEKYILISPVDMGHWKDHKAKSVEVLLPIAQQRVKEGREDELLPMEHDNYTLYTARAYLDYVNNPHSCNLPIYADRGSWDQLKKIRQKGLFIMGETDSYGFGNVLNHLQTINDNSKNKDNVVKVIKGAGHCFHGQELTLANEILKFVQEK